jgi:hypothetical protein
MGPKEDAAFTSDSEPRFCYLCISLTPREERGPSVDRLPVYTKNEKTKWTHPTLALTVADTATDGGGMENEKTKWTHPIYVLTVEDSNNGST